MNQYIISLPASGDLQAIADYLAGENIPQSEAQKSEWLEDYARLAARKG
ncbi:MAG: hypothetical protein ACYT04_59980 [Nostoc sp.]